MEEIVRERFIPILLTVSPTNHLRALNSAIYRTTWPRAERTVVSNLFTLASAILILRKPTNDTADP